MIAQYKYPECANLISRINQCFERSMNGVRLCANDDRKNPEMNALIDYMQWLDRQAVARHLHMPSSAFPEIPKNLTGDSKRGGRIFLQKCAFCHGAEGEGRYQSGSYYRPALWGSQSYNASAGMFKTASSDPPAFIKANMPFGSGGELTDQEAWDLAAFINDTSIHPRPGS
jgi:cytochrome c